VFLAEKGYELGVKTHLEMQDAELNLLTAKSNLARVMLEWVAGTRPTGAPAP
jgi:outer membrane protein TolC